jgi:hypothetical protein
VLAIISVRSSFGRKRRMHLAARRVNIVVRRDKLVVDAC